MLARWKIYTNHATEPDMTRKKWPTFGYIKYFFGYFVSFSRSSIRTHIIVFSGAIYVSIVQWLLHAPLDVELLHVLM